MPSKFKFTRDEITGAARNLTRRTGTDGLTARALIDFAVRWIEENRK